MARVKTVAIAHRVKIVVTARLAATVPRASKSVATVASRPLSRVPHSRRKTPTAAISKAE